MTLSFVLSHSVFHILQIICFCVLFARLCLSTDEDMKVTSTGRNIACTVPILDYLVWSSSRFWLSSMTEIALSDPLSTSRFVICKLLSITAFILLCFSCRESKPGDYQGIPTQVSKHIITKENGMNSISDENDKSIKANNSSILYYAKALYVNKYIPQIIISCIAFITL